MPEELNGLVGRIPPTRVLALCEQFGLDVEALMMRLLPVAAGYAQVPISAFRVGAVALGRTSSGDDVGALYLGANVEFAGQALGFSVHAEQSAVINAWQHGEVGLAAIATSAAPCGHCRQFLHELVDSARLRVLEPGSGHGVERRVATLPELLPHAFGAQDLGIEGGLMDPRFEDLTLTVRDEDPLVRAALDAAQRSYVPYSGGRAGCAILCANREFVGRYAESAAYNPSVSPLEAAVAFQLMNSPRGEASRVTRAVLVELPTSAGQRGAAEAVLWSLAPGVELEYHEAVAG